MSRNLATPALRARDERVDALLGTGKDRALRHSDLEDEVAGLVARIVANTPTPIGAALSQSVLLRPAPGVIFGTGLQAGLGTAALSANQERIMPFAANFDLPIDQIGLSISGASAGQNCKITVYDSDAAGRPSKMIHETADISAAATGTFMIATTLTLKAGRAYWIGVRASASITFRTLGANSYAALSWTTAATPAPIGALTRSLAYATAATDWVYSSASHALAAPVLILMRAA